MSELDGFGGLRVPHIHDVIDYEMTELVLPVLGFVEKALESFFSFSKGNLSLMNQFENKTWRTYRGYKVQRRDQRKVYHRIPFPSAWFQSV